MSLQPNPRTRIRRYEPEALSIPNAESSPNTDAALVDLSPRMCQQKQENARLVVSC